MDTNYTKLILPGIKSISLAKLEEAEIDKFYNETNTFNVTGNFVQLPIAGLCSFDTSSEVVKGQLIYTYTVKGSLFDQNTINLWQWNAIPVCAKVTDINRSTYLLGSKEKPFATCSIGLSIENEASGKRYRGLTLSFKSPDPLYFCH
jgi:hypothetical protein